MSYKVSSKTKASGLSALKLRKIKTDVNFGNVDGKNVQVTTTVKKSGLGNLNVSVNWK